MNPDELDFLRHLKKEENQNVALNLIKSLDDRTLGHLKKNVKSKEDRELYAEEELIRKEKYDELRCEMPGTPRSTFIMVFSSDGTKVASTHGNHNIYVTDLRSGKNVKTLIGHPRTPWCIAFHPTSNQIVASGCLGGQVRIWDLSGGSEVWTTSNQSVIASIAFHPNDRILVIATINEVYFWDWSKPEPFCHTATANQKEKIRYVAFDKLGHKLITGITNSQNRWDYVRSSVPVSRQSERSVSPYRRRIRCNFDARFQRNAQPSPANNSPREPLSSVPERERNITMCYRNLVREYGRLVQRYLQLYRPPAMIDRGTDPMEPNNLANSSSSTQVPETSTLNQPSGSSSSSSSNDYPSTSTQDSSSTANQNPYQLLTPSRILAVMNRPTTLIRGTQTTESRKHKAETSNTHEEQRSEKKLRFNKSTSEEIPADKFKETSSTIHRSESVPSSPQPGPSRALESNLNQRSDREQVLEDIIHSNSSSFRIQNDLFEVIRPTDPSYSETARSGPIGNNTSSRNYTSEPQGQVNSLANTSASDNILHRNTDIRTSSTASRRASQNALMDFLNKLPKVSKATQKSSRSSDDDSSSSGDDGFVNIGKNRRTSSVEQSSQVNRCNQGTSMQSQIRNVCEEASTEKESTTPMRTEAQVSSGSSSIQAPVDYSLPGTSRGDTEIESSPREAQRLELMMMNIRRNAEEKLRSRFLPLIRSVPENDRLELIRLFEQGVKESREKARLRYRNMGQMFNKKPNRRPVLDTSSDSSSSEDERDPLHMNFFNNPVQNETAGTEGSSVSEQSTSAGRSEGTTEPSSRDAYHNINNLENWVTSLFDDIEPQGSATCDASTNVTASVTTTTASTSTTIDRLLDRPPRPNRVLTIRRIYAKVLRDRVNSGSSNTTTTATTSNSTSSSSTPSCPVNAAGNTSTRTTNSTIYSLARRRLGTQRVSAFMPTRVYYPRTPPEFRRSRLTAVGRWRLSQRPYRSNNIGERLISSPIVNNSNNFASDEVINFSELPNSEDDPVPAVDRRSSSTSPMFPYHFHPFNPPPDLPTINPENIGIGNMYSNIVQDLETSLNDVRNIRAANRPGEMSDMLSNFSERLENIMNQSETILRNLRTSVEMLPGNENNEGIQSTGPRASFNDANFYVRDQRTDGNDLETGIDGILGENLPTTVTSDHTYPRNSDTSASPSSSSDPMSPLMTSLHLTISHIQRQARLLRQQVESIERIDRAMVEVAQLQLMRLLLVELSRYVRNTSGESRSTCMSSVRQMMAGTRISDSGPAERQGNNGGNVHTPNLQTEPSTSSMSCDSNNLPSARTRGLTHKTYPPSRLSRLQRHYYRRATFIHHVPRRYSLRVPPRNAPSLLTPPVSFNLGQQSMLHMYSRINTFTLNRMSRRLEELINEQARIFSHRSFVRVSPRMLGGNMGEQNLATRLRDSITRTNRLVGSIFDTNVIRNYRMDATAVSRDGVDRFYARQTLSFIIDGISSHLDETRGSPLPHNIRLQLQAVMSMSMLLSELLLLHIVDSIPPPTDMNLDQERQSLTNRIDRMCTSMMLSNRYGAHLVHSLRQLQSIVRQNSNITSNNLSERRRGLPTRSRALDVRSRASYRMNMLNRMRNTLQPLPTRPEERSGSSQAPEVESQPTEENAEQSSDRETIENRINALRRMRNSLHSLYNRMEDQPDSNQETEDRSTGERSTADNSQQSAESLDLRVRALEARTRALRRMQMMDQMRSSLRSLPNRFDDQSEPSQAQNSESDDNSREPGSVRDRELRFLNSWLDNSRNRPSPDRSNEVTRPAETSPDTSSNFFAHHPFRVAPTYGRPPTQNSTTPPSSNNSVEWPGFSRWPWNVPSVQVNDVPLSDLGPSQESSESDNPQNLANNNNNNNNNNNSYPTRGVMARLAAIRAVSHPLGVFRPRFLHPLYASVNPFDADLDDPQREHIYDSDVVTTVTPNHRIQVWDISDSVVPVIRNPLKNVVVSECKIHNDASVDMASDGSILVTLLPSGGYLNVTNRLGVYSLKWETLGQCLYTTNFDHNAVSVSLSPLGRHLVVGLASRRVSIVPSERWMMARVFRIEQKDIPGDRLPVVRELDQSRDGRATSHKSVNCIKWLPTSGQGLIYATNTGQLVIWT